MAINLGISMASPSISVPRSSSFSLRRTTVKTYCSLQGLPPVNPNDPIISKLKFSASTSLEKLHNRPADEFHTSPEKLHNISPQLLEFLQRKLDQRGKTCMSDHEPPPDVASAIMDLRIVYIGMPLVSAVSELIIAELLCLQRTNEPIYLFINSSGTTREDGEVVALDSEAFAIYDFLMSLKCEVRTLAMGCALGHACLLLAAGTKGHRYMFPSAIAAIKQPRVAQSRLMQTTGVLSHTKLAVHNRETLIRLFAKHTGNSEELVREKMKSTYYMDCIEAKKFGVIDKIIWHGREERMKRTCPPEFWNESTEFWDGFQASKI